MAENNRSLKERILETFTGSDGLVSVAVVLLGFLAGTILILAVGRNPMDMYFSLIQVVSGWYIRWEPAQEVWITRFNGISGNGSSCPCL